MNAKSMLVSGSLRRRKLHSRWVGAALCSISVFVLASPCPADSPEPQTADVAATDEADEVAPPTLAWNRSTPWYTYWEEQKPRWFASGSVGVGAYNQLDLILGHGRPHYQFWGLNMQAGTTSQFANFFVGPRVDWLAINGLFAFQGSWAYSRKRPTQEAMNESSFEIDSNVPNRYFSLDAWLWGYLPLGPVIGYWEVLGVYALRDPGDYVLFEEFMYTHLGGRTGLMTSLRLPWQLFKGSFYLGPAVDAVFSKDRGPLLRVGGLVGLQFTTHIAFNLLATVPVIQPDAVPWSYQYWGIARLSYSFASGEPRLGW